METRLEQRATIKACVHAGDDFKSTLRRIRAAWTDHALSITQIRHWFKVFSADPEHTTKDGSHSGRPRSARTDRNAAQLQTQLHVDTRQTVRQLATAVNVSAASTHRILKKDLHLKKLSPKFVPHVLTQLQKDSRVEICREHITKIECDPGILARIIATDESWMYTFDPRRNMSDMVWIADDVPRPRKALRARSQKKTMLILFFDSHGVVHTFFLDEGTVTTKIYLQAVQGMRESLRRKHPDLWNDQNFILLQDNALPHTSDDAEEYFDQMGMELWKHPAYSPDISPCDYWAFPLLKSKIRGYRFQTLEDLKTTVKRELANIPLSEFQNCFDNLLRCYRKCVEAGGAYFEGQGKRGLPKD